MHCIASSKTGTGKAVFLLLSLGVIFSNRKKCTHNAHTLSHIDQGLRLFKKTLCEHPSNNKVNHGIDFLCGLLSKVRALGTNPVNNVMFLLCDKFSTVVGNQSHPLCWIINAFVLTFSSVSQQLQLILFSLLASLANLSYLHLKWQFKLKFLPSPCFTVLKLLTCHDMGDKCSDCIVWIWMPCTLFVCLKSTT